MRLVYYAVRILHLVILLAMLSLFYTVECVLTLLTLCTLS